MFWYFGNGSRGWLPILLKQVNVGLVFVLLAVVSLPVGTLVADEGVEYERDVKPILRERCYACHGGLKQEMGLRLDTAELVRKGGRSGPVVESGNAEGSLLIDMVTGRRGTRMPPEGEALLPAQIQLLEKWIDQGTHGPVDETPETDPRDHWAFRPPVRPAVPPLADSGSSRNPVDVFISATAARHGVEPKAPADKHVLLRRVFLDLIGLPPTTGDFRAFLEDPSPDAYEKVVDRLLANPQYGERWGRHWMDVWRYSDWYGRRAANDVRNSSAQIWRWRDWIVNSLNSDKGYDRMILEMLAGDEIAPDDPDVVVATGFIVRNCYRLNFRTWKQDMVEHTGKAFLGLTFNCAHCHDHKYDPISQANYFQFHAFFEPLMMRHDRLAGVPDPGPFTISDFHSNGDKPTKGGIARVYDGFPDAPTHMYHRGDPRNIMQDKRPVFPAVPAFLESQSLNIQPVDLPTVAFYPGAENFIQAEERQERVAALTAARDALKKYEARLPQEIASLNIAVEKAEAKYQDAQSDLSAALKYSLANEKPAGTRKGQVSPERRLGAWRFEGTGEEGVLLDSSGNGLLLLRSTGNDERVSPFTLPLAGEGSGFFRPVPHTAASNRQAMLFDQEGGESFLYTIAGPDLQADEFTIEMCVLINTSQQRRTLVDYEGVWALEYQGLSSTSSELRLQLIGADGKAEEISSGTGETPLRLVVGHDYYVAVVVQEQQITFFARNLSVAAELQSVQIERHAEMAELALPGERASFNIGRSSGGQRHRGLLDELRVTRGHLSADEIAVRATISPHQQRLARARQSLATPRENLKLVHLEQTVLRLQLEDAHSQSLLLDARIAADQAKYLEQSPDAGIKAVAANQAERATAVSTSKVKLAQAMQALAKVRVALWSDPKQAASMNEVEQQLKQARDQVTTAIEKQLEPPSRGYTSLTQVFPRQSTGRRTALARWIASHSNPLTARVAVNHIWLRHFGRALVESVYDFGRNGKHPTHPQLLDWLTVDLLESGWSMKHLHRRVVTSHTYRLQSKVDDQDRDNLAIDPENRYLWHFNSRRMEAEIVRDSVLAAAGELDLKFGGQDIATEHGATRPRRSLYFTVHPEDGHLKFMSVFDPPNPCDCYRRGESVVPQQALAMTNSQIVVQQSRLLARKMWQEIQRQEPEEHLREGAFISSAFARILSRYPNSREQVVCRVFLQDQVQLFQQADAEQLAGKTPDGSVAPSADPYMRARESLVGAIYSHNDFVTIR
jgi:hypothetical protein